MNKMLWTYQKKPNFPATDQHPDAKRYMVAGYVVDAVGGEPTEAEVEAHLNPPIDYRQLRLEAYRARGATETACIEAIIEYMGGKPEKMNALAAIRDSVKQDFPKP